MRTNNTTKAILRALAQPSNPMIVPSTLATTMGYELTFMPQLWDRIYTKTNGTVKTWSNYGDYVCAQAGTMRRIAEYKDGSDNVWRKFEAFKTDPMVVEVTTRPTNKGTKLRNVVRDAFKYADIAELQPRALCSRGGGAHLHVGLIGNTREEKYAFAVALQHEVFLNPWMAWAFANPLDESNAAQVRELVPMQKASFNNDKQYEANTWLRRQAFSILDYNSDYHYYRQYVADYTKQLHQPHVWQDADERSYKSGLVKEYTMHAITYRKRQLKKEKELLAAMEKDWNEHLAMLHIEAIAEDKARTNNKPVVDERPVYGCEDFPRVAWHNMMTRTDKCYAAAHRQMLGTMEFRCFMMYEHHADHAKQINLANALVKRAMHKVATTEGVRLYGPNVAPLLRDMKYSEAKAAFCNMLRSLDIDPSYYREECVNIALRKRAIRNNKIRV